ncbi:MAG: metallo-beta-lactamase superfamily protein [Osedax symbiont Rs1]|nr:MAG: metallo-beta-lactamase superfamily protein [Osedax symbiont Rs1]
MFNVKPISAFEDNYIWLIQGAGSEVAVVDPGDAQVVIRELEKNAKKLTAILITHHHSDHTAGVDELVDRYSVPVYGPKNCKFSAISQPLAEGDQVTLFGKTLIVKAVPGHTLDHISYLYSDRQSSQVFCGDTLFLAGCGRVFEGSMQQMLAAMDYFKKLPPATRVYCTHEYSLSNLAFAQTVEPENQHIAEKLIECRALRAADKPTLPSVIATELLINPFLRCDQLQVIKQVASYADCAVNSELEVFSMLRNWKNVF